MAGLVGYASSDEEDEVQVSQPAKVKPAPEQPAKPEPAQSQEPEPKVAAKSSQEPQKPGPQDEKPVVGPALGPSLPPPSNDAYDPPTPTIDTSQAPGSPYSANRAVIHDLTLPSNPNFDIPPSPPGSPPPGASKKFEQFLDLKKKGVHFNAKLESSTSLRNPGLMDKLMGFVEIDGRSQYETTLPTDLWNPKGFPDSAFRERLRKAQERIEKEREAEKSGGGRTAVDFVPAITQQPGGEASAGGLSRGEKRKGGWN